jgi:hypothetical protein
VGLYYVHQSYRPRSSRPPHTGTGWNRQPPITRMAFENPCFKVRICLKTPYTSKIHIKESLPIIALFLLRSIKLHLIVWTLVSLRWGSYLLLLWQQNPGARIQQPTSVFVLRRR